MGCTYPLFSLTSKVIKNMKLNKPRYQWEWIGSRFAHSLPNKDYIIIDTLNNNEIIDSSNDPLYIKYRLKQLNHG